MAVQVSVNSTNRTQPEGDATSRLAQASAEYEKLSASLSELGSQLAALGVAIQGQTPSAIDVAEAPSQIVVGTLKQAPDTPQEPDPNLIRIHLLGPFGLFIDGRNIAAGMPGQVQTVLKYVLSQGGHPVSKDALLDLLWPETDPAVTGSRLRVLMHTLRRGVACDSLGFHDFLVLSGSNFSVNPQARLWIDVDDFERSWHTGWRLQRAGDIAAALKEYERAESLYKGDYLEDDPYSDWTLLRREALRDAYSTILTMLASMSLEASDYTGAIIWAQKLLTQDNCREDAYRFLMSSHSRLGQTSRAVHWYNLCVRTLARELGMEPSPETQALHRAVTEATAQAPV
jgi:DNA-binding SARP family transcriptional activator